MGLAGEIVPLLIGVGDQVWLAVISLIGVIFGSAMTAMLEVQRRRQIESDKKTEAMDRKLDRAAVFGEATYIFQNHAMGEQKKLTAISARTLAESSGKPEHIALAEAAEHVYQEHREGQAKVDANAMIQEAEVRAKKLLDVARGEARSVLEEAAGGKEDRDAEKVAVKSMAATEIKLDDVTEKMAKLTTVTDKIVQGVGEQVEAVDAKVEKVHEALEEKKGGA